MPRNAESKARYYTREYKEQDRAWRNTSQGYVTFAKRSDENIIVLAIRRGTTYLYTAGRSSPEDAGFIADNISCLSQAANRSNALKEALKDADHYQQGSSVETALREGNAVTCLCSVNETSGRYTIEVSSIQVPRRRD